MSSFSYGLILSLLLIFGSWIWLQFDAVTYFQQQDLPPWGQIYERENQVYIQTQLESGWHVARIHTALSSKTVNIQSQDRAFLSILLSKKRGKFEIGENSDIHIHIKEDTKTRFSCDIEVKKGDMYISLFGLKKQVCYLKWKGRTVAYFSNADITIRPIEDEIRIYAHRGQATLFEDELLYKDMWARIHRNKTEIFNEDFFILTPFANDQVLQSQDTRTRFKWAHVPENAQMQLWVGATKDRLKPVWPTPIPSNEDQGYFRFPLGIHYWQMTATILPSATLEDKNKKEYKTQIYKILIKPEVRPILTFPNQGFTKFVTNKKFEKYRFVWQNTSRLEKMFIEISTDSSFLTTVFKKPVLNFGFIEIFNHFPAGRYFWRISGFRHNSSEMLRSPTHHFTVAHKNSDFQKIKSWPKDSEKIHRLNVLWGESKFVWDAFSGFQKIRLQITNLKSQQAQIFPVAMIQNRINIPKLSLGLYQWKIQGISDGSENQWIDITEPKKIEIISTLSLDSIQLQNRRLMWTPGPSHTDHYVVIIRRHHLSSTTRPSRIVVKKVRNPQWLIDSTLSESDLFSIKIMAVNRQNQVIAISREKNLILPPASSRDISSLEQLDDLQF